MTNVKAIDKPSSSTANTRNNEENITETQPKFNKIYLISTDVQTDAHDDEEMK